MLLKILLGPVLLLQGKWVRKKTPQLPEPVSQPRGAIGSGPTISLLLLGDSSAAGVGAQTQQQSLLGQILGNLSGSHQVNYQMLATTGQTTAGMITYLQHEQHSSCDVVITALGVNDVTSQVDPQTWIKQQKQLIALIKQLYSPKTIILSGLPPMRDFPALPWPLSAYMGHCADQLDKLLANHCQTQNELQYVSLRTFPKDIKAATDGFHPGPEVYKLWAQILVDRILKIT